MFYQHKMIGVLHLISWIIILFFFIFGSKVKTVDTKT